MTPVRHLVAAVEAGQRLTATDFALAILASEAPISPFELALLKGSLGISQARFAEILGVSPRTVQSYLAGTSRIPRAIAALALVAPIVYSANMAPEVAL